jgi:hypothetical protein
MQPRNETFFTLFSKAGSSVVESAAILIEFVAAPHERQAELAKRMRDIEYAGDETTKGGMGKAESTKAHRTSVRASTHALRLRARSERPSRSVCTDLPLIGH